MNEELEALERELAGLMPRAVSPGVAERVAAALAHAERVRRRMWAGAALAAAACVVLGAALAWRWMEPAGVARRHDPAPGPRMAIPPDRSLPTALVYEAAWRQSPEALEALLDRHAEALLPRTPEERAGSWRG